MNVTSVSSLSAAMQSFDKAALRAVSSAQGISEPSSSSSDLTGRLADLSVSGQVVKATAATVAVENELQSETLNIVA
jgi:hypothetical protein